MKHLSTITLLVALSACIIGEDFVGECPPQIQLPPDCEPLEAGGLADLINEYTGEPQRRIQAPVNSVQAIRILLASLREDMGEAPECAAVRWTDQPLTWEGKEYTGLHLSCNDIWVVAQEGKIDFRDTSLAHEILGHCGRRFTLGEPDNGHGDEDWWGEGGPVHQGQKALAACGI